MGILTVPTEKEKKMLTMAEYIERDAISEEIRKYYYKNPPNFSYGEGFYRGLDRAQRAILDAPAADVVPVRHGRWICIRKGYEEYECSVCHGMDSNCSDYYADHVVTEQDYCPFCGARMDGGAD